MSLQELLAKRAATPLALMLPRAWFDGLADTLFQQSIDLQGAIAAAKPDTPDFAAIRKKVFDFDLSVRRAVAGRLWLLGGSLAAVAVALGLAVLATLYALGMVGTIWNAAQVALGLQYIALALAGAIIHLITAPPPGQTAWVTPLPLGKGIFLAIVVPIVLLMLFSDGKTFQLSLRQDGQIVSFACGYSAKLAIDVLNKLVDKASKIIDAI